MIWYSQRMLPWTTLSSSTILNWCFFHKICSDTPKPCTSLHYQMFSDNPPSTLCRTMVQPKWKDHHKGNMGTRRTRSHQSTHLKTIQIQPCTMCDKVLERLKKPVLQKPLFIHHAHHLFWPCVLEYWLKHNSKKNITGLPLYLTETHRQTAVSSPCPLLVPGTIVIHKSRNWTHHWTFLLHLKSVRFWCFNKLCMSIPEIREWKNKSVSVKNSQICVSLAVTHPNRNISRSITKRHLNSIPACQPNSYLPVKVKVTKNHLSALYVSFKTLSKRNFLLSSFNK